MKSIYDEAIETFHDMHPEYDTANGGTHILHDKVLNALKRAKKVEELLDLYWFKINYLEDYYTYNSLRGSQQAFDNLKDVNEEICLKEKELEALK